MRAIAKIVIMIAFSSALPLFLFATSAQQKECTHEEAKTAIDQADQLKDWRSAYEFFKHFGHCDDGAIAEGYSDSVAKLLAKDWKHLGILNDLISNHKDFKNFVFRHIDETADTADLRAIVKNARLRCPSGKEALCKSLEHKARFSLRNIAQMGIGSKSN
jgi:hypothetical protein